MTQQVRVRSWRDPLGRVGLAAKGVVYVVVGILAVQFARGDTSSSSVNQEGAIERVAQQPFGRFLLVLIVIGLVALTLWHVLLVLTGDPVDGSDPSDRAKYLAKAAIYGALTATAFSITRANWSGSGSQEASQGGSGDQTEQQATSMLLDLPAGRLIAGGVGVALIGVAIYQFVHHAVQSSFTKRVDPPTEVEPAVTAAGRVGYAAQAIVFALIGGFMIVAAVQYDPNESKGLSGSLAELARHDGGVVVLWSVAVGMVAYGAFSLAEARYRRAA